MTNALKIDAYRRRRRDKPTWGPAVSDEATFIADTLAALKAAGPPCEISVGHAQYGPARNIAFLADRLPVLLAGEPAGTSIALRCKTGKEFAIQRIQTTLHPANTEGSPAIDLIHAAVVKEFGSRDWGLFSVGIYVNKPGEHGAVGDGWKGNAEDWEFADSTQDTSISDGKLRELGGFLVGEQAKGLPVGGVISQGMWWSPSSGGWHPFDVGSDRFTRHYTHLHTSGSPERVPSWI
jgi:hypothetical protein